MMKGIAAVRSRRAERNLKRAAGGTGSFTGVVAAGERQNWDFKRSVAEKYGSLPAIPECFPNRAYETT